MPSLMELFQARRGLLLRELEAAPDVKSGFDACARALSEIRRAYLDACQDGAERARLNALMGAAASAMAAMVSVSQVDISMRLLGGTRPMTGVTGATGSSGLPAPVERRRRGLRRGASLLPGALGALLAALLFIDGKLGYMALAAASSVASFVYAPLSMRKTDRLPEVTGVTRVDPTELCRRVERLMLDVDSLMERDAIPAERPLELTEGLMASIQMLMEARLTGDGDFALRALPGMLDALGRQGIDVMMYQPDARQHFDLLPAPEGGETIRPALMKDGRLLLRGQATIKG